MRACLCCSVYLWFMKAHCKEKRFRKKVSKGFLYVKGLLLRRKPCNIIFEGFRVEGFLVWLRGFRSHTLTVRFGSLPRYKLRLKILFPKMSDRNMHVYIENVAYSTHRPQKFYKCLENVCRQTEYTQANTLLLTLTA